MSIESQKNGTKRLTADKLWCMRVAVASKKEPQLFCDDRLIDDAIHQAARTNAGPSWHRLARNIVVYGSEQKELRPEWHCRRLDSL